MLLAAYFLQVDKLCTTLTGFTVFHFEGHSLDGNKLIDSLQSVVSFFPDAARSNRAQMALKQALGPHAADR
jgi:hypothetical protein